MRLSSFLLLCGVVLLFPFASTADEGPAMSEFTFRIGNRERKVRLAVIEHEEHTAHRTAQPTCTPSQNDTRETFDAVDWHLPTNGLTYVINTRRAPREIRVTAADAMTRAVDTWRTADPSTVLVSGGTARATRSRFDHENAILWGSLRRGIVAVAYVWYDVATGEVIEADMVLSTSVKWSVNDPSAGDCGGTAQTYDVQAVATHELGHWIGLNDLYDTADADLTMYGLVMHQELKKDTLGVGDIAGVRALAP